MIYTQLLPSKASEFSGSGATGTVSIVFVGKAIIQPWKLGRKQSRQLMKEWQKSKGMHSSVRMFSEMLGRH